MSTPAPQGWNKTVDDLLTELSQGKRQQLSADVRFLAFLNGRVETSGTARLPQGVSVRIFGGDSPKAIHWSFRPLRYDGLHESIVPEDIRRRPGYNGYLLDVRVGY